MAIYVYYCPKCKDSFEEMQRSVEDSARPCPACGRPAERSAVYQIALGTKEKKYRVSDFQEASQELDHAHSRQEQHEGRKVKWPSPYKAAMRKVRHASL